jgi:hypothetical protein
MVMQGHRHLNETLQELLIRRNRSPPHVFPNLMRLKESAVIEKPNGTQVRFLIHRNFEPIGSLRPSK